ncbi:MAG: hypothetical protein IKL48_01555 [Elusimicrobiaceae bacterium]|nr:hypothetical protein [Elusimicrobiaceae bacterium]
MTADYKNVVKSLQSTFGKAFYDKAQYIPVAENIAALFEGFRSLLCQYQLCNTGLNQQVLLKKYAAELEQEILNSLCLFCQQKADCAACRLQAACITKSFIEALPDIQNLLITDIRAAYEGDPAAVDEIETLLCYPGVMAITYQRMAHFLYKQGVRIIPRIITEHAHSLTGIDIHPGASIGPSFFIDHGTGVVIGETCVIGANVKLYQGVTLGAKSFPLDANGNPVKGIKRHPNLANNVIIYAETTVLGNITIGEGAVIGANKWITHDIPPHSKVN